MMNQNREPDASNKNWRAFDNLRVAFGKLHTAQRAEPGHSTRVRARGEVGRTDGSGEVLPRGPIRPGVRRRGRCPGGCSQRTHSRLGRKPVRRGQGPGPGLPHVAGSEGVQPPARDRGVLSGDSDHSVGRADGLVLRRRSGSAGEARARPKRFDWEAHRMGGVTRPVSRRRAGPGSGGVAPRGHANTRDDVGPTHDSRNDMGDGPVLGVGRRHGIYRRIRRGLGERQ